MSILLQPFFWDERAAHAKLEEIVWPSGPICPRCGATDRIGAVTGKGARAGLKFCCRCRKQFRATIGTVFEGSHVPLHKWFQASFLLSAAENEISAHKLHLRLEVTNKTALKIVHRLQEALRGAEYNPLDGTGALSWAETWDLRRPQWRRTTAAHGAHANGRDDSLWTQFPTPPARQFRGFVETARELGCNEDDIRFDQVLTRIGRHLALSRKPKAPIWPLPEPVASHARAPALVAATA